MHVISRSKKIEKKVQDQRNFKGNETANRWEKFIYTEIFTWEKKKKTICEHTYNIDMFIFCTT